MPYLRFDNVDLLLQSVHQRRRIADLPLQQALACEGGILLATDGNDVRAFVSIEAAAAGGEAATDRPRPHSLLPALVVDKLPRDTTTVPLKQLLQSLPLVHRMGPPYRVRDLVLGMKTTAAELDGTLHKAWLSLPLSVDAASEFLVGKVGDEAWQFAHVHGLRAGWKLREWQEQQPLVTIFLPNEHFEDLFTAWPWAHSRPEYMSELHTHGGDRLLLAMPENSRESPDPDRYQGTVWIDLHLNSDLTYTNVVDYGGSGGVPGLRQVPMSPITAAPRPLSQPLTLVSVTEAHNDVARLEIRLRQAERELDHLHATLGERRAAMVQKVRALFVFRQPADTEILPPRLEQFLARPLGELQALRYQRLPTADGHTLHCLLGDRAVHPSVARAAACDALFVQDGRFHEWRLPLFLPDGCQLSIGIHDETVARKLCGDLLGDEHLQADEILVWGLGPMLAVGGGSVDRDVFRVDFTGTENIGQVLAPLAVDSAGERTARHRLRGDAARQAAAAGLAATARALELDELHRRRAAELVEQAEKMAADVRARVQTTEAALDVTDKAAAEVDKCLATLPKTWVEYVRHVVTASSAIRGDWAQGAEGWRQAIREADTIGKQIETESKELLAQVNARREEYERALAKCRERRLEIEQRTRDADAQCVILARERDDLQRAAVDSSRRIGQLEEAIHAKQQAERVNRSLLDDLAAKTREHEELTKRVAAGEADVPTRLDALRRAIDESRRLLREHEPEPEPPAVRAPEPEIAPRRRRWWWPFDWWSGNRGSN